jgi:capsular polysaccharide biosynthesis protein
VSEPPAEISMSIPEPESTHYPTFLDAEIDQLLERPEPEPPEPEPRSAAARALDAIRRYPWHAAIPLVACLAVALVLATLRAPVYTAQARLGIGRIDVSTYSIPGWVSASRSLAGAYSRALKTPAVTSPVAQQLHISTAQVDSRLSASPIPASPVIVVKAKGSSERDAVALANAAKSALIAYVTRLNRSNPDSARLLRDYESALLRLRNARQARATQPKSAGQQTLDQLDARIAKAELETTTLNGLYRASQQGQAATDVIQVLSPASSARSDSGAFLQRLLFVGLIAGLVAGVAVALLRARIDRSILS